MLSDFILEDAFIFQSVDFFFYTALLLIFWHRPNGAHLLPLFSSMQVV